MDKLTARQRDVVALLAQGKAPKDIALALVISRRTVYSHLREAQYRTGTSTTLELAVKAAGGKGE